MKVFIRRYVRQILWESQITEFCTFCIKINSDYTPNGYTMPAKFRDYFLPYIHTIQENTKLYLNLKMPPEIKIHNCSSP